MAAKWEKMFSADNGVEYWFDAESIEYKAYSDVDAKFYGKPLNKEEIYYWEKQIFTSQVVEEITERYNDERFLKTAYSLTYIKLSKKPKMFTYYDTIYYDENGQVIEHIEGHATGNNLRIVPGTVGEGKYILITTYCEIFDKEITARSMGKR
jgi:hypothetical protein